MEWIPIDDERFPSNGQYVLVSFVNYPIPTIAKYRIDEDGGYFCSTGGTDIKFLDIGLIANAWMPLPDPYRKEEI